MSYPGPNLPQGLYSQDDLPKTLVRTLNQGSPVTSMDFHPLQHTILLGMALLCDTIYFSCLGFRSIHMFRNAYSVLEGMCAIIFLHI